MCLLENGYNFTCTDKRASMGGFNQTFYLFNKEDLDVRAGTSGVTYDADGAITNLHFLPTKGIYKYKAAQNTLGVNITSTSTDAGLRLFTVEAEFMTYAVTQAQRNKLEDLANAESLCMIVKRETGQYMIAGLGFGMRVSEYSTNFGKITTENSANMYKIKSEGEMKLPIVFFDTDVPTTEDKISDWILP